MRNLPAEWTTQSGIMLTWPHSKSDWQASLDKIDTLYTLLTKVITQYEKVLICCYDDDHIEHVTTLLNNAGINIQLQISFAISPSNDSWTRDHGPISIFEDNQPLLLDFQFNGWGNKYPAELDNAITLNVYQQRKLGACKLIPSQLILEGGSIDSDGEGTILTTSQCLLSKQRNPNLSKQQLTDELKNTLGVDRILWLDHGRLVGDDTDSHVDMLARFCNPSTIAYTCCEQDNDEHFHELKKMEKELQHFTQKNGAPYQLLPLPIPTAKFSIDGKRLPASYANFLIINNAVLVPSYEDPADEIAMQAIRKCFPDREVIGIPSLPLIQQYGSLHCASMQLPAGVLI